MNDYADVHRKHMAHEIEKQDREWATLNRIHKNPHEMTPLQWVLATLIAICVIVETTCQIYIKIQKSAEFDSAGFGPCKGTIQACNEIRKAIQQGGPNE